MLYFNIFRLFNKEIKKKTCYNYCEVIEDRIWATQYNQQPGKFILLFYFMQYSNKDEAIETNRLSNSLLK